MNKTAIILFAHLPEFEARAKSLSGYSSQKATEKLSGILTRHFYNLSKKTTAETFLIDTYLQKGKSFGERIANAFADVYAKGYENVICIGNDCPTLNLEQLQNAVFETEKGNVVLGPTQDGGAYLIGIPKSQFNNVEFLNVKWQSRKTFKDLSKSFDHKIVVELYLLTDIDSENDLLKYSNRNNLVLILLNEIARFLQKLNPRSYFIFIHNFIFKNIYFRGPPSPTN